MLFLFTLSLFLRSIFQKILLQKISILLSLKFSVQLFISGLSMIITPGGSGQIIKSQILKDKYSAPIKKSLPLIIAERFFDLFAISLILSFTLFFDYLTYVSTTLFISFTIMIFFVFIIRSKKVFDKINSKLNIFKKYLSDDDVFYLSTRKLFSLDIFLKSLLFIIPATLIDGLIIYSGFLSFNVDLGFVQTIQFFYSSLLAGVFSFIPGGLGITEGSLILQLLSKDIPLSLSTSMTIFVRLMTIWLATVLGFTFYFIMFKNKKQNSQ